MVADITQKKVRDATLWPEGCQEETMMWLKMIKKSMNQQKYSSPAYSGGVGSKYYTT